jgi:hypothetical protein
MNLPLCRALAQQTPPHLPDNRPQSPPPQPLGAPAGATHTTREYRAKTFTGPV